jgi:outer membrane murein-binding lipoprotein Lpp
MRQMPMAAVVAALVLLGGCQKSFDERYAEAQKKIGEQAASIDKELAAKASEAALTEPTQAPASSPAAPADRIPRR